MTVTWAANTVTLSASGVHTTQNIVDAAGAPAGANTELNNGTMLAYNMRGVRVVIEDGSAWVAIHDQNDADSCTWVYHEYSGAGAAVELQGSTSRFEWGHLVTDDADAPVTARGNGYWFVTTDPDQHWSRNGADPGGGLGIFRFYGGMLEQGATVAYINGSSGGTPTPPFTITGGTSGATALVSRVDVSSGTFAGGTATGFFVLRRQSTLGASNGETLTFSAGATGSAEASGTWILPQLYMPSSECRIYQAIWAKMGGVRFFGTDSQVLETFFKRSSELGFTFESGANTGVLRKITTIRSAAGFTLAGSGSATLRDVSMRSMTQDVVSVSGWTGSLTLVDSDDIGTGTLVFDGGSDATTNFIAEQTSYAGQTVDDSGVGVDGIRTQTAHLASYRINGVEGITETPPGGLAGTIPEYLNTRTRYDKDNTTAGSGLDFGNYVVRLRRYGVLFIEQQKIPSPAPLRESVLLEENPFTLDGTVGQFDDDLAAALTGVEIIDGELDTLGSAVTLTFTASARTIVRSSGDFVADGFRDETTLSIWDSANNDGTVEILTATASTLTLREGEPIVDEGPVSRPVLRAFLIDITAGTANTLPLIYSKLQSLQHQLNALNVPQLLSTGDGLNFELARASIITGLQANEIDLGGGSIVRGDTVSRIVGVIFNNITTGTVCAVVRVDNKEVLGIATSTGTSVQVITIYPGTDVQVFVRARQAGNVPFEAVVTLLAAGLTVATVFPTDAVFM